MMGDTPVQIRGRHPRVRPSFFLPTLGIPIKVLVFFPARSLRPCLLEGIWPWTLCGSAVLRVTNGCG
jgi:hypothetical protein